MKKLKKCKFHFGKQVTIKIKKIYFLLDKLTTRIIFLSLVDFFSNLNKIFTFLVPC